VTRIPASRVSRTTAGILFGVTSSVSFGAIGPFAKALIEGGFTPMQVVWLRIAGAMVILVPGCAVVRGREMVRSFRRHGVAIGAYGLLGVAGCSALSFISISRLPVGIAVLLEYTGPVLVVGWVRFVRRRHVARVSAAGVLVALVGLCLVVEIWTNIHLDTVGVLAGFGAGAGNASYFILIDRLSGAVDPLTLTTGGMVVGTVSLLPLALPWSAPWAVLGRHVAVGTHVAPGWLLAASVILISTVLAYLAGAAAVQRLSAPIAAGLAYVEPASAVVIAWLALGERLSGTQIAGGVIVLAGAFLAQRGIDSEPSGSPDAVAGALVPRDLQEAAGPQGPREPREPIQLSVP
jgi:drug/metabolite transporter (DMT)-like permease